MASLRKRGARRRVPDLLLVSAGPSLQKRLLPRAGLVFPAALLLAACTGRLGGVEGEEGLSSDPNAPGAGAVDANGEPLEVRPLVVSRLNRLEYNYTVRDLLGSELAPADSFPSDGMAGGFETVGSALSLAPTYVLAYEQAAHELVEELFARSGGKRDEIVHCDVEEGESATSEECARSILTDFAREAWRRPVTDEEIDAVLLPVRTAAEVGATRTDGIKHALAAVLMSPFFIFKLEVDDDPTSTEARQLTPHELATRLSYTLWSTMPDDELSAAADGGALSTDEEVATQVDRMLDDPRSDGLIESFAASWLEFKKLDTHQVEADAFPEYDAELAASMRQEAFEFVRDFLHSDRPAPEMLTADFTYVDERLANFYGLPFSEEDAGTFRRVDTTNTERVGLLTLGALLTTTSFSSRTSPVRRGEFVFSHMLCGSIPPPPPEVEGLPIDASGLTLRERLELHREDPSCAACHDVMDPLGFGFENYDAIGRYRTEDGTAPVDASGELPDGTTFEGAAELSALLGTDPRFAECVTKKFMIYSGRRLLGGRNDEGWVTHLSTHAQEVDGGSLRSIVRSMLLSPPFRTRVPSGG